MLSAGPGPGTLVATAAAWTSLSLEYASAADELMTVLGAVQAGAWEGPSAQSYIAAHAPYLAWLTQAGTDAAAAAGQHEIAAAAYTAALAAMPTLAELAANHVTHGVLVATNFFGINTIPITLNEADYARMWVQAATTMTSYQAVSEAAVATTPQTTPAPQILKSDDAAQPTKGSDPLQEILQQLGVNWDPTNETVNGIPYDDYTNPADPLWWFVRAIEISAKFQDLGNMLLTNPAEFLPTLMYFVVETVTVHGPQLLTWLTQSPLLLSVGLGLTIANLGAVSGLAGLTGLAAIPAGLPVVAPALAPIPAHLWPATGIAPTAAAVAAPAAAPTVPAAPTAPAPPAPPPTPPVPGAAGFAYPYAVGGGPGIGYDSGMSTPASSSAKRKAPEPDTSAAAAAAAAQQQARARRRRRATQRGYGDEFMNMNVEVDPDWGAPPGQEQAASAMASNRAAGALGFTGKADTAEITRPAGLATLARDAFGGTPTEPMMPTGWGHHGGETGEDDD